MTECGCHSRQRTPQIEPFNGLYRVKIGKYGHRRGAPVRAHLRVRRFGNIPHQPRGGAGIKAVGVGRTQQCKRTPRKRAQPTARGTNRKEPCQRWQDPIIGNIPFHPTVPNTHGTEWVWEGIRLRQGHDLTKQGQTGPVPSNIQIFTSEFAIAFHGKLASHYDSL